MCNKFFVDWHVPRRSTREELNHITLQIPDNNLALAVAFVLRVGEFLIRSHSALLRDVGRSLLGVVALHLPVALAHKVVFFIVLLR
jgi:hypothetical protein